MDEPEHSSRQLRGWSFEAFMKLLFEEIPAAKDGGLSLVLNEPDLICADYDPSENLAHLTRLFESPELLQARLATDLAAALRFMSFIGDWREGFVDQLWNPEVPWEARRHCIGSFEGLYAAMGSTKDDRLKEELFMLWDVVAYDYRHDKKTLAGPEDARVQEAMFETLLRILDLPDDLCRGAALHGLNHLAHARTAEVIGSWIDRNHGLDEDLRTYAYACAACRAL